MGEKWERMNYIDNENCEMATTISSSHADSASVPGVAFKEVIQADWATALAGGI